MVDNFVFEIDNHGAVLNTDRAYYLTRSQTRFLSSMGRAVHEAQEAAGQNDWARIETAYDYVKRDHEVWTQAAHLAGSAGLSRYYEFGEGPAEEALQDENDVLLHPTLPGMRKRRNNSLKWKKSTREDTYAFGC
jgi:alpha,alpha-trehalase